MATIVERHNVDHWRIQKGRPVNVEQLASDYSLILITLKRADCPACQQLLHYLNLYGLDPDMTEYNDPFLNETLRIDPEQKKVIKGSSLC